MGDCSATRNESTASSFHAGVDVICLMKAVVYEKVVGQATVSVSLRVCRT